MPKLSDREQMLRKKPKCQRYPGERGRVSVVRESECSNPKTMGSIPWWPGQGEGQFFSVSPSQLLCRLNLFVPDPPHPPFVCTARTQICAHVKDPIAICRKKIRPHNRWFGNKKTLHTGRGGGSWVAPYCGCSLSSSKAARIARALHWDKKVI